MLEQRSPETNVVQQGTLFDKATLEQLKDERRQWEETTVSKSQQRLPERDNLITTSSVPINRVYTPHRGGHQQAFQVPAHTGSNGPLHRFRYADTLRLRHGPRACRGRVW